MSKGYSVFNWYWLADDGRVWGSQSESLLSADDATYKAWASDGTVPTPWPRDDAGHQTDASLQAVVDPFGKFVNLSYYAAAKRYEIETSGVSVTIGGSSAPMSTKREDRDGARDTLAAIAQGWRKDGGMFKFDDGIPRAATNDEMKAAIAAAFAHVQAAYDAEGAVQADLASKKPKIKTRDAVDAALAVTAEASA